MIEQVKQELIKYGKLAGEKNYTPGISGNISSRIGEKFVITASGSANGYLEEKDFSIVDITGEYIDGNSKPSSERFLHLDFYKKRVDINCIFHMHSPYLTAFAAAGKALEAAISPEIVYCFDKIPLAQYALPGSEELVNKTSIYFKDYDIILLENHGVIVGGNSVRETYLKLELAEEYAKTVLFANLLGGAKILPEDEVKKIYSLK
ncbi:MAG: class II aldolase/adducin family protein [Candidatus Gastranaerophilales bacterium]|nr:class II aldolase/adducin family protein [Candidatus Gastranaerophilales bacterium]